VDEPRLCGAGDGGRLNTPAPQAAGARPSWLERGLAAAERGIHTARLRLEPLHAGHAAELWPVLSDPRLYAHVPQDPPASVEWLARRYTLLESRLSPEGDELWLNWVLRQRERGGCIGSVQVTVYGDASAYFAYELGSAFWGQGLACEACAAVLQVLQADFGVRRVVAEVDTLNGASIRLLERLGFERTALQREADTFKGRSSDEFRYERALGGGSSGDDPTFALSPGGDRAAG
jgi:RimJ/RimL family protein N-acetyltransferase